MAQSKVNRKANASVSPVHSQCKCTCPGCCSKPMNQINHITPAMLGHRCPEDAQNAIRFHRGTLSEEVCSFLLSTPPNLRILLKFWSHPERRSLTTGACADTICGNSWMLATNYLLLGQIDAARAFILNGGFVLQCTQKPIEEIMALSRGGAPVCDHVVTTDLPFFRNAIASLHSREHMEKYLIRVLPRDFIRRMSFAAHAGHQAGKSTWVSDYVSIIGNDWESSSQHQGKQRVVKGIDDSTIQVAMFNTDSKETVQMPIGVSHTMKELFTKYSEEQGTSLRDLRFSFQGKTLFLSSASNKTPAQLGLRNHDVIQVTPVTSSQDKHVPPSPAPKKKTSSKKSSKKRSNKSKKPNKVTYDEQTPKVIHSQSLSKVFEEAEPKFKAIRQQLNTLNLERTLPKERSFERKASPSAQQPVNNPNMSGIAGKAGKSSYIIHVGEVENLYKSSKKAQASVPKAQTIDLHGCTQIEAVDKLNEHLPQWEKLAMEGSYPWVAPVVIICGGGNQVLSDTVKKWIKENNVSNAPKMCYFS